MSSILAAGKPTALADCGHRLNGHWKPITRSRTISSAGGGVFIEERKTVGPLSNGRLASLQPSGRDAYPRYARDPQSSIDIPTFIQRYDSLKTSLSSHEHVQLAGRIVSVRQSGSRLAFIVISAESARLQVYLNFRVLHEKGISQSTFSETLRLLRRGDTISVKGHPYRTETGELSIKVTELPNMLTPCLHDFPTYRGDHANLTEIEQTQADRHVEMLSANNVVQTLKIRTEIIDGIRDFLKRRGQIEVQTPIIEADAGGAVARPFETTATEFPDRVLNLRIAPELWLKRLVVGGMERVFEIGPSFRNEG